MDKREMCGYLNGVDYTMKWQIEQDELEESQDFCKKCCTYYHTWRDLKICECTREEQIGNT